MSVNPDDVFTITLATDVHLGCHEKDGIRYDDSFITFEEILDLSVKKDVDFILLAGDLFHENKPSAACVKKCIELLRRYCMGDKPISVQFLSDERENFKNCPVPIVNYQDPNYNISIPVYSIHGNHDDPCGFERTSALDVVSASGLINYVGKWVDLTQITIKPILLRKGKTFVAIYGLSHIRDERLTRLIKADCVKFERPPNKDSWFNILVLHQNRVNRQVNSTNVIHETMLPDFFDLVIWGHEHECRIEPEWNESQSFYVTQPGSSVATSLCEAEAGEKKMGYLIINQKEFKIEPIKLQTVRPFVFCSASITDWKAEETKWDDKKFQSYTEKFIKSRLLTQADELITNHPKQPKLPLIRLRLEYQDDSQVFNQIRASQGFSNSVANPSDVIILKKAPPTTRASRKDNKALTAELPKNHHETLTVESLIHHFFKEENENDEEKVKNMEVLSIAGMTEAVRRFVEKDDKDAIMNVTKIQIDRAVKHLKGSQVAPSKDQLNGALKEYKDKTSSKPEDELEEVRKLLESDMTNISSVLSETVSTRLISDTLSSDDDFGPSLETTVQPKTTRGRGRGRARGARAAKTATSTRGRGKAADTSLRNQSITGFLSRSTLSATSVSRIEDSDEEEDPFAKRTPRKKARIAYNDE